MNKRRDHRRGGFTVVELLVAMAVVTILLSLLLPAVQSARENGRRLQCSSHLRQLAVATEGHVAANGEYPRFFSTASYHEQLLPYLDRASVYHQLNLDEDIRGMGEPPSAVYNEAFLNLSIPVFACPSDDVPAGGNSYRANYGTTPGIHATWARGRPLPETIEEESLWGVFLGAHKPREVQDGLSNTAMFSERLVGDGDPDHYTPATDVLRVDGHNYRPPDTVARCSRATGTEEHASFLGWTWLGDDYSQTGYNHVLTPNSRIPDCFDGWNEFSLAQGAMTARSRHRGGVNVAFADGATKFVSESIDLYVWRRLGTSDGGETVDEF